MPRAGSQTRLALRGPSTGVFSGVSKVLLCVVDGEIVVVVSVDTERCICGENGDDNLERGFGGGVVC